MSILKDNLNAPHKSNGQGIRWCVLSYYLCNEEWRINNRAKGGTHLYFYYLEVIDDIAFTNWSSLFPLTRDALRSFAFSVLNAFMLLSIILL